MSDVMILGGDSPTKPSSMRLRVFGNTRQISGEANAAGVEHRVFGPLVPYHSVEGFSGSPVAAQFAAPADHFHYKLWNIRGGSTVMPAWRQFSQLIYTAGANTDTGAAGEQSSLILHAGAKSAAGAQLANEISIDTTATSPSGGNFVGRVVFRNSSNPSVTVGTNYLLAVQNNTVAGIQAAFYTAVGAVASSEVSPGVWQYELDVAGLDASHWTATAGTPGGSQQGVSISTTNYFVTPASLLTASSIAIPSVSGDPSLLDVTLSSVPVNLTVGHVFSIRFTSVGSITGLTAGLWYPGQVVSINGSVVRVRFTEASGARYDGVPTIGGSVAGAVFAVSDGVRDFQHDVVPTYMLGAIYRNSKGVTRAVALGGVSFATAAQRSVGCGLNIHVQSSDTWAAGTNQASNRMELVENVLRVNGLRVGAAGTSVARVRHGRATLAAGTATVTDANTTTTARIFVSHAVDGGTVGWLRVSARIAGTSFTITSSSGTDTSQVDWMMVEP
jgi:hypothetical protein